MRAHIPIVTLVLLLTPVVVPGLTAATANAEVITVCWDGSGDYLTIQEGIDAASGGDEVVVCDGTYTGPLNKNLDFHGKAITVRSANGPENCIIDCENDGRGFHFQSGEPTEALVDGFTIVNGHEWLGAAIYCDGASPTIANCHMIGNSADGGGGAIAWYYSDTAAIINCTIIGNYCGYLGGGILWHDIGTGVIVNCKIAGNSSGFVIGGLSVALYGGTADVSGCTIVGNSSVDPADCACELSGAVNVVNSVLWDNTPCQVEGGFVSYCDVQGGRDGEGNIDADPLFLDPDGPDDDPSTWEDNDYRLSIGSPCIDAGDNDGVPADVLDLDGDDDTEEPMPFDLGGDLRFIDDPDTDDTGHGEPPIVDMGAYEYQIPGDLNGDGGVDHADLNLLLSDWGCSGGDCPGDCDFDGDTDHSDLGILLHYWGTGSP